MIPSFGGTPLKRPVKYANGRVDADETAYEPYLHTGSDYDSDSVARSVNPAQLVAERNFYGRTKGLRRFCIFCCLVSTAISLGILGVSVDVIITLEQSKTARLLWSYNMMMKAWPLTGAPAVPTYVTVSAASAAALLNAVLLLAVICGVSVQHISACHLVVGTNKTSSAVASTPLVLQAHSPWPRMCLLPPGSLQLW